MTSDMRRFLDRELGAIRELIRDKCPRMAIERIDSVRPLLSREHRELVPGERMRDGDLVLNRRVYRAAAVS